MKIQSQREMAIDGGRDWSYAAMGKNVWECQKMEGAWKNLPQKDSDGAQHC